MFRHYCKHLLLRMQFFFSGRSTQHSTYQDNNLAPYLQKVVHTHIVPVSSSRRTRPTSAKSEVSVYTDDSDFLDISSASELGSNRKLRNRPQSAPASKRCVMLLSLAKNDESYLML